MSRRPAVGRYCRVVLVIVVGMPLSVAADEGRLTEDEFLAPITAEHPAVVALTERLARAEGERRAARWKNPEFVFDREAPDGAANQSIWSLQWQPPLDGRRGLRKKAAEAGVLAAESEFDWAKLQLRVQLRGVYAEWAHVSERRDLLLAHMTVVQQLADRARARAATGEESGLGARRLALAVAEVQGELARTSAALTRVEAKVRVVHPELQPGVRPVRTPLPVIPALVDALDRPDVEAQRFEVQQAEFKRRLSGRFLEFPEVMGGWTRFDDAPGVVEGPVFGVSWSVPIFDRNQGERAHATRNVAIAEARLELLETRARAELEAAHGIYARLRTEATDVMAVTADANELIESATAAFRVGENTLTDLLETLRSVLSSQIAALDLHHDALEAHRRLEASAGKSLSSGGRE